MSQHHGEAGAYDYWSFYGDGRFRERTSSNRFRFSYVGSYEVKGETLHLTVQKRTGWTLGLGVDFLCDGDFRLSWQDLNHLTADGQYENPQLHRLRKDDSDLLLPLPRLQWRPRSTLNEDRWGQIAEIRRPGWRLRDICELTLSLAYADSSDRYGLLYSRYTASKGRTVCLVQGERMKGLSPFLILDDELGPKGRLGVPNRPDWEYRWSDHGYDLSLVFSGNPHPEALSKSIVWEQLGRKPGFEVAWSDP